MHLVTNSTTWNLLRFFHWSFIFFPAHKKIFIFLGHAVRKHCHCSVSSYFVPQFQHLNTPEIYLDVLWPVQFAYSRNVRYTPLISAVWVQQTSTEPLLTRFALSSPCLIFVFIRNLHKKKDCGTKQVLSEGNVTIGQGVPGKSTVTLWQILDRYITNISKYYKTIYSYIQKTHLLVILHNLLGKSIFM